MLVFRVNPIMAIPRVKNSSPRPTVPNGSVSKKKGKISFKDVLEKEMRKDKK